MTRASERLPRIPSWGVTKLKERTERSGAEAREYLKEVPPDQTETFVVAGMNALAEKFYILCRNSASPPETIRIYADLLLKYMDQKIKVVKNQLLSRRLELLEKNRKALEEVARDRGLTDQQFFGKIRDIFTCEKPARNASHNDADGPVKDANHNGHRQTPALIENGITS